MINWLFKPWRWAIGYGCLLCLAFGYVLLDAFVIPRAQTGVVAADTQAAAPAATPAAQAEQTPVITESSYADERISITIETVRTEETTYYVADIRLAEAGLLKTALAGDTYGRNIKDTTSAMAQAHDAIFAVNGDYYGFRDTGYVLRNGVLYREGGEGDALVVDTQGDLRIVDQGADAAGWLPDAWQVFSFGPALVEDGEIVVDEESEVARSRGTSNPRTAIGQAGPLHYIVVVSDGRTSRSEGLSLLSLAQVFIDHGAYVAYNLDGGGSSTMVFDGEVINVPTSGRSIGEREVSDIVYIGYE